MIRKHLQSTFRNLERNRRFTLVNILGLSLGMTAFILIAGYVGNQFRYNTFHQNYNTLYRVIMSDQGQYTAYTPPGMMPLLAPDLSGITAYCRIAEGANLGTGIVQSEEKNESFRENSFAYADGSFFDLFTFPVVKGDANTLKFPNRVALSQSAATKYFSNSDPIGKSITLNSQFGKITYTVGAIYEDAPRVSDLRYDMVFSLETLNNPANLNGNDWANLESIGGEWLHTYVSVPQTATLKFLEDRISSELQKRNTESESAAHMQWIGDMHLGQSMNDPNPTYASLGFVYALGAIALVVILIAMFNYINLATAAALKRAKEVGVRKIIGASRLQLVGQFMIESLAYATIALVVSIAIMNVLTGPAEQLTGEEIGLGVMGTRYAIAAVLVLLGGSIATGLYVGYSLSGFKPLNIVRGTFIRTGTGSGIRRFLVVAQFAASIIIIVITLVLHRQAEYMLQKDLGLDKEQILIFRGAEVGRDETFSGRASGFENSLREMGFVSAVSKSGNVPMEGFNFSTSGITTMNPPPGAEKENFNMLGVDDQYLRTYNIALAGGRVFSKEECEKPWNEKRVIMVNEKALEALGIPSTNDALGQRLKWGERELEIVGVVRDYHHTNVRENIAPMIFIPDDNPVYYSIRLMPGEMNTQVSAIEAAFRKTFPGNPFEYRFMDQLFEKQYEQEQRYALIFSVASGTAIFIACLGLFGLATYSVDQRVKEIGVRKVLGCSVPRIVMLLTTDFLKLVFIGILVAMPLAWHLADQWLEGFAYKTNLSWWIFAVAGLATLLVAFITIANRAYRGAVANPVDSLRSE